MRRAIIALGLLVGMASTVQAACLVPQRTTKTCQEKCPMGSRFVAADVEIHPAYAEPFTKILAEKPIANGWSAKVQTGRYAVSVWFNLECR